MSRSIKPIADRGNPVQVGKIRLYHVAPGQKFPEPLKEFRVTANDKETLKPLAEHYGKTIEPWAPSNKKSKSNDKWGIKVGTSIDVILLGSPSAAVNERYELRDKDTGHLLRFCNGGAGETACQIRNEKGPGMLNSHCLCQKGEASCTGKATMFVAIKQAATSGVFRVETGEWGSVGGLSQAAQQCFLMQTNPNLRMAEGKLIYNERPTSYYDPKTNAFKKGRVAYPQLVPPTGGRHTLGQTIERISIPALGSGDQAGWETPALTPASFDDEVVDAEIVDEDPLATESDIKQMIEAGSKWKERNSVEAKLASVICAQYNVSSVESLTANMVDTIINDLENDQFSLT